MGDLFHAGNEIGELKKVKGIEKREFDIDNISVFSLLVFIYYSGKNFDDGSKVPAILYLPLISEQMSGHNKSTALYKKVEKCSELRL